MKIIFLAPGLSRVKRGMERFFLELSGELRKSGLDATCWGTSEAPGVEPIPVASRIDLEHFAKDQLKRVGGLPPAHPQVVQTWAVYAEDQLFAIPAALRIRQLLESGESVLVYARWQGGLIDPSGDSTELLRVLAAGIRQGKAALLVHTDYFYAPIDAMLWNAGACFHSLGPWLTAPLCQQGVAPEAILELPMCIDAAPYRSAREHRESVRAELRIPQDAFVVLSVGTFDLAAKRHDYVLAEIQRLAGERVWWVVAGSRGSEPAAWEEEARCALGSRFILLSDVRFERMPRIYAAADVFVSASFYETFGLVYLEAQMAGLPVVAHDTVVTRHLFSRLPEKFKTASLIDMRRAGAAAAAMSRWMAMLANTGERASTRAALEAFAGAQEREFGWASMAPKFAESFLRVTQSTAGIARGDRQRLAQGDEQLHRHGVRLFQEGKLADALTFIARSLGARETAERWNDWATVQSALGNPQDAEQGFRRALALAPNHAQAAANLGAVLAAAGRFEDAIPFLEKGVAGVDQNQRAAFTQILEAARAKLSAKQSLSENDISAFFEMQVARAAIPGERRSEIVAYCTVLLKEIPPAGPGHRLLGIGAHGDLLASALKRFLGYESVEWRASSVFQMNSSHFLRKSRPAVVLSEATRFLRPARFSGKDHFSPSAPPADSSITPETSSPGAKEAPSARHNLAQRVSSGYAVANSESAVGATQALSQDVRPCFFDVVVLSQILEGIADDPMRLIAEANRTLKHGGTLVLTAANIASARSLHTLLRGGTPYVDGRFSPGGKAVHHREYTASELETLAKAGGFGEIRTITRDIFWKSLDALMASLAASGFSVAARGDTIFLTARRESSVRDRFPAKLYDLSSAQSNMVNAEKNAPLRILVIFETLPLPEGGGADHRLLQIIRLLREQGHAATFLAPRTSGNNTRSSVLKEMGVEVRLEDAEVLRLEGIDVVGKWTLQEVLREGQFDLAMISLWFWMGINLPEHYLDEIRRMSPSTRIAILSDDYHGLREQGGAEISGLWSDRERAIDFAERELEAYRRADLVISISDSDRKKIAREIGKTPIEVLPMMIETPSEATQQTQTSSFSQENTSNVILSQAKDPSFFSVNRSDHVRSDERARTTSPGFEERDGVVYLGHFNNPPTLDGLEWYIREVAPIVRKQLPDLRLYIVGAQLPENWSTPDPNVVRVGFRPDLAAEFAKYRILVSPVRFGTGIKTKNLHAIAHGLPIVTNTKGADGANFVSGETALIADDPMEFASAVVELYTDRGLWEKLSKNSRAHAEKHFSKAVMNESLQAILDRARTLKPQPCDPSHVWSMRLVEKMFLEVSSYQPARDRHAIRVLAYSRAAEELLAHGNRTEARRQLRHVFNYFSHTVSRSIFFGSMPNVVEAMERTYRALGEIEGAEEFRREARQFSAAVFAETVTPAARSAELATAPAAFPTLPSKPGVGRNRHKNAKLDLSVVLPTYNRVDVLADCLGALNRQSLSPHRFEVIVVDDGSTDGTRELCAKHRPRHKFDYLQQKNGGAGAARRLGVEHARGRYLLLINDDTIVGRGLLAQHLKLQQAHASEKMAVLGDFKYAEAAKKRALTCFLSSQPFLFPQVGLKAGVYTNHSFFITCNISVRRDLVLAAGSFDANFRLGEDTELGVRLMRNGLKVIYSPEIEAIHDHLDFRLADLICRAESYGRVLVKLFKKHPDLVADGKGVLGTLDANSLGKIDSFIVEHEAEIPAAMESLAKFDSIDFLPFFSKQLDGKNAAEAVTELFKCSIPTVYWYHLFKSFLAARDTGLNSTPAAANLIAQRADA